MRERFGPLGWGNCAGRGHLGPSARSNWQRVSRRVRALSMRRQRAGLCSVHLQRSVEQQPAWQELWEELWTNGPLHGNVTRDNA